MKIIPGVGLIASAGAPATGGRRRRTNAGTEPIQATATTSWGISVIVEDSAPPGVRIVGRLARGTAGETRRVVHVFELDAARGMSEQRFSGGPGGGAPG